ncbi:hypothetical protein ACFE04_023369 [Oxalis oulophora]
MALNKFYSIIKSTTEDNQEMILPASFPKSIIDEMGDYVSIETPNGLSWTVNGIPLWFLKEHETWFGFWYDICFIGVEGHALEPSGNGRFEGAICNGGWKYALGKLKPSVGDTIGFELRYDLVKKNSIFSIRIVRKLNFGNGRGTYEVGSSSTIQN